MFLPDLLLVGFYMVLLMAWAHIFKFPRILTMIGYYALILVYVIKG